MQTADDKANSYYINGFNLRKRKLTKSQGTECNGKIKASDDLKPSKRRRKATLAQHQSLSIDADTKYNKANKSVFEPTSQIEQRLAEDKKKQQKYLPDQSQQQQQQQHSEQKSAFSIKISRNSLYIAFEGTNTPSTASQILQERQLHPKQHPQSDQSSQSDNQSQNPREHQSQQEQQSQDNHQSHQEESRLEQPSRQGEQQHQQHQPQPHNNHNRLSTEISIELSQQQSLVIENTHTSPSSSQQPQVYHRPQEEQQSQLDHRLISIQLSQNNNLLIKGTHTSPSTSHTSPSTSQLQLEHQPQLEYQTENERQSQHQLEIENQSNQREQSHQLQIENQSNQREQSHQQQYRKRKQISEVTPKLTSSVPKKSRSLQIDVPLLLHPLRNQFQPELQTQLQQQEQQSQHQTSLLTALHVENDASITDTESCGIVQLQTEKEQGIFKCSYCPKTYKTEKYYLLHCKKHIQTVTTNRTAGSVKKTHACTLCTAEFDQRHLLTKHNRVHNVKICEICGIECFARDDFKWHSVICLASKEALEGKTGRRTRSCSRFNIKKVRKKKKKKKKTRTIKSTITVKKRKVVSGKNERKKKARTQITKKSRRSASSTNISDSASEAYTSVTDSNYTVCRERVKKWTTDCYNYNLWNNTISVNAVNPKSVTNQNTSTDNNNILRNLRHTLRNVSEWESETDLTCSIDAPAWPSALIPSSYRCTKKQKFLLAKKLRKEAEAKGEAYYPCAHRSCIYGSNIFPLTMHHEVTTHQAMVLHMCPECHKWFTTKEKLIEHRKYHQYHMHCFRCEVMFRCKIDLENHMKLHFIDSLDCRFCTRTFLYRGELINHQRTCPVKLPAIKKIEILDRLGAPKSRVNSSIDNNKLYTSKILIQPPVKLNSMQVKNYFNQQYLRQSITHKRLG